MKYEIDYVEKYNNRKELFKDISIKSAQCSAILGLLFGFMKLAGIIYDEVSAAKWFITLLGSGAITAAVSSAGFAGAAAYSKKLAKKCEKAVEQMNNKNEELNIL